MEGKTVAFQSYMSHMYMVMYVMNYYYILLD